MPGGPHSCGRDHIKTELAPDLGLALIGLDDIRRDMIEPVE
jgi:hypothetical protein